MSTSTSTEIAVPADLLPNMRERVLAELEHVNGELSRTICDSERGSGAQRDIDDDCERVETVIAAYRVLKANAEAYPADVVELAAQLVIEDATSRIAHDSLSVDEAEAAIARVRAAEALRATFEQQQAVTA